LNVQRLVLLPSVNEAQDIWMRLAAVPLGQVLQDIDLLTESEPAAEMYQRSMPTEEALNATPHHLPMFDTLKPLGLLYSK
jgi:hypothetical protein